MRNIVASAAIFALSTAGSAGAQGLSRPISSALIFVLGVTVIGAITGLRSGLVAAVLASAIYNFFLSEPVLQFSASSADEYVPLIAFNLCAVVSGILAGRLNDRARIAEQARGRLNVLLAVSDELQSAVTPADIVAAMNNPQVRAWLGPVEIYDDRCNIVAQAGHGPVWRELALVRFQARIHRSDAHGATIARLETGSTWLGTAIFGNPPTAQSQPALDIDALAAMLTMAMERCRLLQQLSLAEATRRSDEFKTALLSSLSHDMRTPLSAISASASSLLSLSDDLDPAVRLKLLRTIGEQCERLDRYTANLLDLGLLEAGIGEDKLSQVDVVEIMGAVLRAARSGATTHILSKQVGCASALVRANPVMIEQILTNILDNARRYSPEGSTIGIKVFDEGGFVRIDIFDSGCGIAASALPHVFNRYYRSSRTAHHEGHGLGLSIAKGFVEAFDGTIDIHSPHAGGQGTQVVVRLPLLRAERELAHG